MLLNLIKIIKHYFVNLCDDIKKQLMKPFTKIAAVLLALVSLLHLLRVILNVDLMVGNSEVPMWVSVMGFIIPLLLSIGLWRESKRL